MNKNLKLFTSDQDRLAFEDSNSYERPYVSAVSGDAHFNKLITGTIENPSIGEVNVQNGDYFDRISLQKNISIGSGRNNILSFPFDVTINELREAFYPYKIDKVKFASDLTCGIKVDSQGVITRDSWNSDNIRTIANYSKKDGTLIIPAGKPFMLLVNVKDEFQKIAMTLTFKNKTIVINNSLISENIPQTDWYFVGTPFKNKTNATGLYTASESDFVIISNGTFYRSQSLSTAATCSGWFEYRGPVPSE